jgi:hypothetical protein
MSIEAPTGGSPIDNEKSKGDVGGLQSRQEKLENIVYVVVIVLLVGFATIFLAVGAIYVSAYNAKEASYEQLMIQVSQQNDKISTLSSELCQVKGIKC